VYREKQWDEEHISWNFDVRQGPINVEWFKGGTTNICYNALDRHVAAGACACWCVGRKLLHWWLGLHVWCGGSLLVFCV
jgi:hypothetical protein